MVKLMGAKSPRAYFTTGKFIPQTMATKRRRRSNMAAGVTSRIADGAKDELSRMVQGKMIHDRAALYHEEP
jgi:hypothetical protein